ncbi:MAG: DUF2283 domain-containing protein [Armatimonadota bacterium]
MRVIYDRETDTLSIVLGQRPVAESDELREGLIVDYDQEGRIVSVEVLDASQHVADPGAMAFEYKNGAPR